MKIHTTQNLSFNQTNHQSTNVVPSKEFRFIKLKDVPEDTFSRNVSFGKRIPFNRIVGQTKEKAVKAIKPVAKGKSPVDGSVNKFLEYTTRHEVVTNAAVSAVLAGVMRPLTLMLISNDKEKNDMAYASAHAISSAVWGFIIPFIFIRPLSGGFNRALENMHEHLSVEEIKRRLPWFNEKDPRNWIDGVVGDMKSVGKIRPLTERKDKKTGKVIQGCYDIYGNKFLMDIKDVYKVPLPKNVAELSKETYTDYFDEAGKLKSLEKAYICLIDESQQEALAKERSLWSKIINKQIKPKYYNLNECTDSVLKEAFPELDIATVGERGKRSFANAKKLDGSEFILDKNLCFISDWRETEKTIPYSTGEWFEFVKTSLFSRKNKIKHKDVCYQKNGANYGKGTPITADMVEAAGVNEVLTKLGQWVPDIGIAYPRAAITIAVLPYILKNVFHLEKPSSKPVKAEKAGA